jgi:hypothetical protein
MKRIARATCLITLSWLWIASANAQVRVAPGQLTLAGYRATCGPVDTLITRIGDIAAASRGRIYLNPAMLSLPRAQQLFWYMHECAHQIFGLGEPRADCWSVEQGRIQGWLSPSEFERLAEIMSARMGDATHADGPERVASMRTCFER